MSESPGEQSRDDARPALKRSIGPVQLALYGLGSMLGAGIYGLIGQAAGLVGNMVGVAFCIALFAALLTAFTYASLGSRYPRAAGAAYVVERAFGLPLLSFVVGLALVCSGLTSVATQSRVFAANLAMLLHTDAVPGSLLAVGFLFVLAGIVFRGIRESMWVNVLCTLVEASGLLIVIAVGLSYWGSVDYLEMPPKTVEGGEWLVLLQGAVLTFFAFIGFEDTLNVAEEVRTPEWTIPFGLILAMSLAAILYVAVAITAVSVVPWQELAAAPGPITEIVRRAAPILPPIVFTGITLFAVANTALVNYVTASRLLYGMAHQGLLPERLGKVHAERQTPHIAVLALLLITVPLALIGSIAELAAATVLLLLAVFTVMNLSLAILKVRREEPQGRFEVPTAVPVLGCGICLALILVRVATGDPGAPAIAGILLLASVALYWLLARKR